jgi:hypothetical protein
MTIFIEPLIDRVRLGLAAAPQEHIDDSQINKALKDAYAFVEKVKDANTDEAYEEKCIVNLAVYYSYVGYLGLATKQLDDVPTATLLLVDNYRAIALAFIQPISTYQLNEDLTINMAGISKIKGLAFSLGATFIEDD